jgi:hypothetical protein
MDRERSVRVLDVVWVKPVTKVRVGRPATKAQAGKPVTEGDYTGKQQAIEE